MVHSKNLPSIHIYICFDFTISNLVVQAWTEREGVRNLLNMVGKEVRMEGFLLNTHFDRFGEFAKEMEGHIKEGRLKPKTKINIGIESFLDSLNSLFSSTNIGKVVVQVNKD